MKAFRVIVDGWINREPIDLHFAVIALNVNAAIEKVERAYDFSAFTGKRITGEVLPESAYLSKMRRDDRLQREDPAYALRVQELEAEGLTTSDAQGVADAELMKRAQIKVGDRVRSYDFEHRRDCYIEGIVEFIGRSIPFTDCDRYKIRVERAVVEGRERRHPGIHVFPPVNGTRRLLGGRCDFVEKI